MNVTLLRKLNVPKIHVWMRGFHKLLNISNLKAPSEISSNYELNFSKYQINQTRFLKFIKKTEAFETIGKIIEIKSGSFPESIVAGDVRLLKKLGDSVLKNDIIAEIETDKTTIEVVSQTDGVIKEFFVNDGQSVGSDVNICAVEGIHEQNSPETPKSQEKPILDETEPLEVQKMQKDPVLPEAKPLVDEKQISSVGKIDTVSVSDEENGYEIKEMSKLRKKIAERLKDAQNTNAILTTFNEIDMTNLMDLRKRINEKFDKQNRKIGILPFFIRASSIALKNNPILNSFIDGDQIIRRKFIDISVAVASKKGLFVPVLRNTPNLSLIEMDAKILEFAEKANKGNILPTDMQGGSFTITNGGTYGSLLSTPILNPPQSAIIGLHTIKKRPMVIKDEIKIRNMMYVALSYDHRLIDGVDAVTFLKEIKEHIENPE